ncbi:MAG: outer membrane lipoprotein-sorting protein [Alphaproteobacteria bacterium]|nr:outer membrane lipoprotein-sorting protein [Alphaproteobacteria bacterium]
MTPVHRLLGSIAFVAALAWVPVANAGDAQKGLEIARAAKDRDEGFGSYRSQAKMILRDKTGTAVERDFIALALEVKGDGDRTSIEFETPLDVRGMTVLTHAHTDRDDDQWLYLPAASRTRRITSGSRSGSFAGSEFSYEDLVGHIIEKNTYEWLRDEPCPSAPDRMCYVNEQRPKDPDSGYSRMVAWIDQQDYRGYKVEYYDRSGALLKTLVSSDFKLFDNKYLRPTKMVMSNFQTGKSTEMRWSSYDFNVKLTPEQMAPYSLGQ